MNPGGTGRCNLLISHNPAPLLPRSCLSSKRNIGIEKQANNGWEESRKGLFRILSLPADPSLKKYTRFFCGWSTKSIAFLTASILLFLHSRKGGFQYEFACPSLRCLNSFCCDQRWRSEIGNENVKNATLFFPPHFLWLAHIIKFCLV